MADEKKYIIYSMRAKCDQGSMENYLTTDTGHGVVYQGNPLLNANDHVKQINLTHFGDCKSQRIFDDARRQAEIKYGYEKNDTSLDTLGKEIMHGLTDIAVGFKQALSFISNKCDLDTPLPWIFTNCEHIIDGAPALTMESMVACRFGGVITITAEVAETSIPSEESYDDMEAKYQLAMSLSMVGIPSKDIENIIMPMIENAQEPYKSLLLQYAEQIRFMPDDGGYYTQGYAHALFSAEATDERGTYNTTLHEVGHLIDDKSSDSGNTFRKDEFYALMLKDVRAHIAKTAQDFIDSTGSPSDAEKIADIIINRETDGANDVDEKVLLALQHQYSILLADPTYTAISDSFGGITDNFLHGKYGHWVDENGNSYWFDKSGNRKNMNEGELWAGYFASQILGQSDIPYSEYFPSSIEYMDGKAKELMESEKTES